MATGLAKSPYVCVQSVILFPASIPAGAALSYKEIGQMEGVRRLSPHCCRHTYVSQLQAVKVNDATIKGLVGHSDIEMTLHYLHIQPGIFEDAAKNSIISWPLPNKFF